ncbi:MAG: thioesterase family protein [Synergistaceae bacterium]|jgi:predicted thioesterase|nr:thioesterase family protein [Synergistaceae bacterium]
MTGKIAVTLATLESHNHIIGDIERGVKIFERGGVEFLEHEPGEYVGHVPHKRGESKTASVKFSRDGRDIEYNFCHCTWRLENSPVCRHVVALVLAIQGGIVNTELTLGKSASAVTKVTEHNTAHAVGSGSTHVFATPMMIALMESAARKCLAGCLSEGQTSVGTQISVEHTAASPLGAEVTATATVERVFGSRIEFIVTALDGSGEIGKGRHTRAIVDAARFMTKASERR